MHALRPQGAADPMVVPSLVLFRGVEAVPHTLTKPRYVELDALHVMQLVGGNDELYVDVIGRRELAERMLFALTPR